MQFGNDSSEVDAVIRFCYQKSAFYSVFYLFCIFFHSIFGCNYPIRRFWYLFWL